jgi:tRNA-dihydrouridine synthase C
VHVQLLGSDPACIAENAAVAAGMGAPAIDINFGCPAKMVNRHRGGAVLLDEPELVHAIVAAVRRAVPAALPVSAKMRLGLPRPRTLSRQRPRLAGSRRGLDHRACAHQGGRLPAAGALA